MTNLDYFQVITSSFVNWILRKEMSIFCSFNKSSILQNLKISFKQYNYTEAKKSKVKGVVVNNNNALPTHKK